MGGGHSSCRCVNFWIVSLTYPIPFVLVALTLWYGCSPAGKLAERIGYRMTGIIGCSLMAIGLLGASFS